MDKQKIGLILFYKAIGWAVVVSVFASLSVSATFKSHTFAELGETIWAIPGVWFFIWAISAPMAALLAGTGMLVYSGAKGKVVMYFSAAVFLVFIIVSIIMHSDIHIPILFGIGGTLILLSFFWILWLWAKERMILHEKRRTAHDLKLVGYVFLLFGMWYICGALSQPHLKALAELKPNPINIMIYLVLGWVSIALGHYKDAQARNG